MTFRSLAVTIVLVILAKIGNAQKIDSLKSLLPGKAGIEKIDLLYEIGKTYNDERQYLEGKVYAGEGYQLAIELKDSLRMVKTGRVYATSLRRMDQYDSAIRVYLRLLAFSNRFDLKQHDYVLIGLAQCYLWTATYDKALEFYFASLKLNEEQRDFDNISIALNNIGLVYYKLRDNKKAVTYYTKCIDLKKKMNNKFDLSLALVNLGLSYQGTSDNDNAEKFLLEGLASCNGPCPYYVETNGNLGLGLVYLNRQDYRRAETFFRTSYQIAAQNEDVRLMLDNIDGLADIFLHENRMKEAFQYLKIGDSITNEHSSYKLERKFVYKHFAKYYEKLSDFKKRSYYQQKFIEVNDSLYNQGLISNLLRVEAEFLAKESEAKLKAQQEVLALKDDVIQNQRQINVISAILIVLSVGFLVLLWGAIQRKKQMNAILDSRFQERSKQFNMVREKLIREFEERNVQLGHASEEILDILQTMQRLSTMASTEISDKAALNYFEQMQRNIQRLLKRITTIAYPPQKTTAGVNIEF